jgi:hypothetical protein
MLVDVEVGFELAFSFEVLLVPNFEDLAEDSQFFRVDRQLLEAELGFDSALLGGNRLSFLCEVEKDVGEREVSLNLLLSVL